MLADLSSMEHLKMQVFQALTLAVNCSLYISNIKLMFLISHVIPADII